VDSVFRGSMANRKRGKARCGAAKANDEIGGLDGQPPKDPFCENLRLSWKQKGAQNVSRISNIFSSRFKVAASFLHGLDRRSSLDKIFEPVSISSAAINQKGIMRCKEICAANNRRLCIAAGLQA